MFFELVFSCACKIKVQLVNYTCTGFIKLIPDPAMYLLFLKRKLQELAIHLAIILSRTITATRLIRYVKQTLTRFYKLSKVFVCA